MRLGWYRAVVKLRRSAKWKFGPRQACHQDPPQLQEPWFDDSSRTGEYLSTPQTISPRDCIDLARWPRILPKLPARNCHSHSHSSHSQPQPQHQLCISINAAELFAARSYFIERASVEFRKIQQSSKQTIIKAKGRGWKKSRSPTSTVEVRRVCQSTPQNFFAVD
jgi:hypothetical protein